MKYLLDTHTLLWFLAGDASLSGKAVQLIENEDNQICVSTASLWEIAIKSSLGKLALATPLESLFTVQLPDNNIQVLTIDPAHLLCIHNLPFHHRDPFDRLLAAQSLVEKIPLVSKDVVMDAYGVQRIW